MEVFSWSIFEAGKGALTDTYSLLKDNNKKD